MSNDSIARVSDPSLRPQRTANISANPVEVAWARAEVRAYLIAAGEIDDPIEYFFQIAFDFAGQVSRGGIDIHAATDALQELADRSHLVAVCGQDAIQSWMSAAFEAAPLDLAVAA